MGAVEGCGRVSVVIPTYNGAEFLAEALHSVLRQSLPPSEILVVDDASTDNTHEVVRAIARTAPLPIQLLCLEHNSGGPAQPLNRGIRVARGEFVAVLDQDDVFLPQRMEKLTRVLTRHPEAAFAFSECGRVEAPELPGADCQPEAVLQHLRREGRPVEDYFLVPGDTAAALLLAHCNYVVGYPGFLFRRSDWERKGGLDESLRITSDFDLLCWLSCHGPVIFVPEKMFLRRTHASNLSTSSRLAAALEIARVIERYLKQQRELAAHPHFQQYFRYLFLWLLDSLPPAEWRLPMIRLLGSFAIARGWNRELLRLAARRLPTCFWRTLRPRRSDATSQEVGELLKLLEAIVPLARKGRTKRTAAVETLASRGH